MATLMTMAGVRAGITTVLKTVPGIGAVYDYRRILRDEAAIRELLTDKTSKRINAWQVYPSGAATTVATRNPGHSGIGTRGGGNVLTVMQWSIDGYYQLDDAGASEKVFADLAWAVVSEFNAYGLIAIPGATMQLPCNMDQFGYANLANFMLVHYCRIDIGFQGTTQR